MTSESEIETHLREILDTSPIGAGISDAEDGTVKYVNSRNLQIFGHTQDDILGKSTKDYWFELADRDEFLEIFRRDGRASREVQMKRSDGTPFWALLTWESLSAFPGDAIFWVHDISGLKKTQEEQKRSEEELIRHRDNLAGLITERTRNLQSILDNLQDIFYRTDLEGRIVMISPSVKNIFGYTPDELIGRKMADFYIDPDERTKFLAELEQGGGSVFGFEGALGHKDGHEVVVSTNAHYYKDEDGQVLGLEGLTRDITERRQAEFAAKIARDQLKEAIEATSEGFALFDKDDRLVLFNSVYRAMYSTHAEAIEVGSTLEDILRAGLAKGAFVDAIGNEEAWLADRLSKHRSLALPVEQRLSNGRWLLISERRTKDGGTVGFRTDITDLKTKETKFRESEERFRDFANSSADWLWEMGPDLRFTFLSSRVEEITGVSIDFILGKTREEMAGDEATMEYWSSHLADLRERRPFKGFRYTRSGPDGREQYISTSGVPVFDAGGDFTGYRGSAADITSQTRAERLLADAVESISEGFVLYDQDDKLVICNKRYLEIYATSAEAIVPGVTFEEVIRFGAERGQYAETEGRIEEFVKERVTRHKNPTGAVEMRLGNGRWIRVEERKTRDGGIVGIRVDITDLKRSETLLRESEARLHDAVNSLHEGFVLYDKDDRLVLCNGVYRAFYPTIADDIVPGVRFEELLRLSVERGQFDLQGLTENEWIAQRLEKHQKCEGMFGHSLTDGRHILYSERRTKDGGIVGTRMDITERVQIEEQARTIEEQLRRSQKMDAVGQLTGGIAHDFNNILGIVVGNLEILQQMVSGNDAALDRVRKALKGAERGASLTRKLLGFSSKEAHGTKLSSLNEFVKNMEELLVKSLTVAIKIENRLADDLWAVNVDPGELEDTILNLALNARDAMPDGGVLTIETANKTFDGGYMKGHPQGKVGEYVMLSISDTGRGMTSEERERIFEPFFTTKEEGQGTGLGLSMVYGFVQRSMGDIDIITAPGEGTTFRIYLPRAIEEGITKEITEDQNAGQIRLLTGSEIILVVDDEEDLVDIAASQLEKLGYRILKAHNGEQALKILKDHKGIDLLFSDVIMPGELNGYQMAIAAQKVHPSLKVLLTSGFTKKKEDYLSPDGLRYMELASDLLKKPYSHTELASAVRITLDRIG